MKRKSFPPTLRGRRLTRQIIDSFAVKSLQAKVFDLSKAIVRGDY
jgi:hypothetical protein